MLTALLVAVAIALGADALDPAASPFTPPYREFERESGYAVAYDAYGDPARIPSLSKEPYDVVMLPGPAFARAIAAGQLRKIEKAGIANARQIAPPPSSPLTRQQFVHEIVHPLCDCPYVVERGDAKLCRATGTLLIQRKDQTWACGGLTQFGSSVIAAKARVRPAGDRCRPRPTMRPHRRNRADRGDGDDIPAPRTRR